MLLKGEGRKNKMVKKRKRVKKRVKTKELIKLLKSPSYNENAFLLWSEGRKSLIRKIRWEKRKKK